MKSFYLPFFSCVLLLNLLNACNNAPGTPDNRAGGVFLNDSLNNIVSVDVVSLRSVDDELTLNGKVTFNEEQVARVFPIFGGTVTESFAEIGDYVHKGEVLAVIRSGEVADYEKQNEEAKQQYAVARRNMESTQDMYTSGMASEKDVLQARQEVNNAKAEVKKMGEIYSIYHLTGKSLYQIKAPVSGFIVSKNISKNMQIRSDQGDDIFTISGLKEVWVMADIYESDISKVHEGEPVSITTLAYPDKVFNGKIDKVYNILNDESKTVNARIKISNADYLLKPGMFANVYVKKISMERKMPCIDPHSLIFDNGKNYVISVGNDKKLAIKEVEIYKQLSRECYLSSGVKEGEHVLNKNALLIYNELNKK